MFVIIKFFIKFGSRLAVFLTHSLILFGIVFYASAGYNIVDILEGVGDYISLFLVYQHLDTFYFAWLSEKAPLTEGIWVVNKVTPLLVFSCVEIYLHCIYFGYLWQIKPASTKTKLNQKHSCALRFWLGFQNSCFSIIISCLFTINSFLAVINTQFGVLIIICFIFTIIYFAALPFFVKIPDYFSPAIGVALANCATLYLYLKGYNQYARMLWLAQLICVCAVCLLLMGLSFFSIQVSVPSTFTKFITHKVNERTDLTESVKGAIIHKSYLNHYLAAINMPKLWSLITQFIQYMHGLLAAEIFIALELAFLLISALTNIAFLPAVGYTQTSLYKILPPISFWLRFEVSTKHYLKILWYSYYGDSALRKVKFPLLHIMALPYNYLHNDNLETILEANTYFIFAETNNPNNITYRCLTNITGVLFQVVLAYYLLGLNLI